MSGCGQLYDADACCENPFRAPPKEDMLFIPSQERQKHLDERERVRDRKVWEKSTTTWKTRPRMMGKPGAGGAVQAAVSARRLANISKPGGAEAADDNTPQDCIVETSSSSPRRASFLGIGSSGASPQASCSSLRAPNVGGVDDGGASSSSPRRASVGGIDKGRPPGSSPRRASLSGAGDAGAPAGSHVDNGDPASPSTRSAHKPIACGSFRRELAEKRRVVHALQIRAEIEKEEAARLAEERRRRKQRNTDAMALMRAAMKANAAGKMMWQLAGDRNSMAVQVVASEGTNASA